MKPKRSEALITDIRDASRQMVRELGMLGAAHQSLGLTNSEVHALLELEKDGQLGVVELSARLRLEKSSVSRLVDGLISEKLVASNLGDKDRRKKFISLTSLGKRRLAEVHEEANVRVGRALETLTSEERSTIARGLELYAEALKNSRGRE